MIIICLWCKKQFKDSPANHRKYCSRLCYENSKTINQAGEKHWNWQGGITPPTNKRINTREWHRRREWIFNRDKEICQRCGIKCNRINYDLAKIQCDHIIPVGQIGSTDDITNLQTLCLKCHMAKTKEETGYNYPDKFCIQCGREIPKKRGKKHWGQVRYCSRSCFQTYMRTPEGKAYYSKIAFQNQFWKHRK